MAYKLKEKYRSAEDIYTDTVLPKIDEIKVWTMLGYSLTKIANELMIPPTTLWRLSKDPANKQLLDALSYNEVSNKLVESALYKKAVGFSQMVRKPIKVKSVYYDKKGRRCEKEEIAYSDEEVYFQPDFASIRYWLNNREPRRWKDEQIDNELINNQIDKVDKFIIKVRELAGIKETK